MSFRLFIVDSPGGEVITRKENQRNQVLERTPLWMSILLVFHSSSYSVMPRVLERRALGETIEKYYWQRTLKVTGPCFVIHAEEEPVTGKQEQDILWHLGHSRGRWRCPYLEAKATDSLERNQSKWEKKKIHQNITSYLIEFVYESMWDTTQDSQNYHEHIWWLTFCLANNSQELFPELSQRSWMNE